MVDRPPREALSSSESDECESGRGTNHSYMTERDSTSRTWKIPDVPFQHYGSFYLRMGAVGMYQCLIVAMFYAITHWDEQPTDKVL